MNAMPATNETTGPAPNGSVPSEMKKLISDLEEVLARAGHVSDADVAHLRESLRQKLAIARAGLSAAGRRVSAAARSAANATDEYVHHSPWQSIGMAALAGVAVGLMLGRRK